MGVPAVLVCWLLGSAVAGSLVMGTTAVGSTLSLLGLGGLAALGAQGVGKLEPGERRAIHVAVALWLAMGVSLLVSPVPRAGVTGWLLGPMSFFAFRGMVRMVRSSNRSLSIELSVAIAVCVVSGVALSAWLLGYGPRPALPLGHHNLLALWLVVLLPVSAAGMRASGPGRWISRLAVVLGGSALAGTRSLAGAVGIAIAIAWVFPLLPGAVQRLLLGGGMLWLGSFLERIAAIVSGQDPSAMARLQYVRAALDGALDRPLMGWGPGSTPWLIAEWLQPLPGWNPPAEGVGEAHSLGAQLLFELGLPLGGGLLLLGASLPLWLASRVHQAEAGIQLRLRFLGSGLLGSWVAMAFAGSPAGVFALPAVWLTVAAIGWGVADSAAPRQPVFPSQRKPGRARQLLWIVPACALLPFELGRWAYDIARKSSEGERRRQSLDWACRLDPRFPLYRALQAAEQEDLEERTQAFRAAAEAARGVAFLWLEAAAEAWSAGDLASAQRAARTALTLDRLNSLPAWILFRTSQGSDLDCAARALALEPRLAAAAAWNQTPVGLRQQALDRLEQWPGLPAAYAEELRRRLDRAGPSSGVVDLVASLDEAASVSLSVHLFQRFPWPRELLRVRLDSSELRALEGQGPAATRGVPSWVFPKEQCAPKSAPPVTR